MGSNKFEAYSRLLTYIENKKGANIDPCGILHTTSLYFINNVFYFPARSYIVVYT